MRHLARFFLLGLPLAILLGWSIWHAAAPPEQRLRTHIQEVVDAFNRGEAYEVDSLLGSDFQLDPPLFSRADFIQMLWGLDYSAASLQARVVPGSLVIGPQLFGADGHRVTLDLEVTDTGAPPPASPFVLRITADTEDIGRGPDLSLVRWQAEGDPPAVEIDAGLMTSTTTVRHQHSSSP